MDRFEKEILWRVYEAAARPLSTAQLHAATSREGGPYIVDALARGQDPRADFGARKQAIAQGWADDCDIFVHDLWAEYLRIRGTSLRGIK